MSVASITDYVGTPLDVEQNFHGNRMIFVRWNDHQLFAGPFCISVNPHQTLRDFITDVLAKVIAPHPDAAAIAWESAVWTKSDAPWQPNLDRSFNENQVGHKELIAFTTPGLNGYRGTGV